MTDPTAAQPIPFVKRVRIKNYKSIADCDVSLGPLTVLLGLNASGKSNFFDALRFVTDALRLGIQEAVASRGGPDKVARHGARHESVLIELELALKSADTNPVVYGFELKLGSQEDRLPVTVLHEWCRLVVSGKNEGFTSGDPDVPSSGFANPMSGLPDLWIRSANGRQRALATLTTAILGLSFHAFEPPVLREIAPAGSGTRLGPRGEGLGDVLGRLAEGWPWKKQRIDDYLAAIVPGAVGINRVHYARRSGFELSMTEEQSGDLVTFDPDQISDGTLRAAAVLAALFQPDSLVGYVTAVCIDEPELGLHPAATGMLFDALTEACEHVQVIVATQSGDLLHRDQIDLDSIRFAAMHNGVTTIDEVDSVTRAIVGQKLATIGERMRGDQIVPAALEDGE